MVDKQTEYEENPQSGERFQIFIKFDMDQLITCAIVCKRNWNRLGLWDDMDLP